MSERFKFVDKISFHYPTRSPKENEKGETEWLPAHHEIGGVRQDGSIENCPYRFNPDRISGGIACTENTKLVKSKTGRLINPATGEEFRKTRKGNGYWGRESRTWVAEPYLQFRPDELGGVDDD